VHSLSLLQLLACFTVLEDSSSRLLIAVLIFGSSTLCVLVHMNDLLPQQQGTDGMCLVASGALQQHMSASHCQSCMAAVCLPVTVTVTECYADVITH
jgi:hypothetical protein